MPTHTHRWTVTRYLMLGLPRQDFRDVLVAWRCTLCLEVVVMTGEMRMGIALGTPEGWDTQAAREQRRQTPEARAARRGQYGSVLHA